VALKEKIQAGKFVVTTEVGPPKGIDTAALINRLALLRDRIDAVNVTDLQSSVMRLGSLAVCSILKQNGYDPVFQLTCRDRNRLALQSDVLSAAALGIENILILTGDHPSLGDHPEAKPVYDLDSVQLLKAASRLAEGFDMNGNRLEGPLPRLYIGGVVNPAADPVEPEIIKMEKKIEAGARFFQTQAIFDPALFASFLKKTAHLAAPVIAGIVLLKSGSMARYMNKHIPGIVVPDECIQRMDGAANKGEESVRIAAEIINSVKQMCRGIHIMPIGWDQHIPSVLDKAGL
jgi:methylenetetrahydrofolate reductase (NADPH)